MSAILEARDLSVTRAGHEVVRLSGLALHAGETLAVLGPNGSGKTSLLLALARLLDATGDLRFRGEPVRDALAYRRRTAVVFQRPLLLGRSVRGNAELGLALRGVPRAERWPRVDRALGRLGIAHLAERSALTLSGGEAQRLSIARALVLDPEILFLDEPFSGLDAPTREALVADLGRVLRDEHVTTLLVTHDREEARALADRLAVLVGGSLRQVGDMPDVFSSPADAEIADFLGVGPRAEAVPAIAPRAANVQRSPP